MFKLKLLSLAANIDQNYDKIKQLFRTCDDKTSKVLCIDILSEKDPNLVGELLGFVRDSLVFLRDGAYTESVDFLESVVGLCKVDGFERLMCCCSVYNNNDISRCFPMFEKIADDESVKVGWRIEACKYLFSSGQDFLVDKSLGVIKNVISNDKIDASLRFDVVLSFGSKSGIRSITNNEKLRVPYDKRFYEELNSVFFWDGCCEIENSNIKLKLLSGQILLQLFEFQTLESQKVCEELLSIARNDSYSENEKAFSVDIVQRLGGDSYAKECLMLIEKIGGGDGTIISSSQNSHHFTNQAISHIEKLFSSINLNTIPSFDTVRDEILSIVQSTNAIESTIKSSLNHISIDTATFSKYSLTLSTVLCMVWGGCSTNLEIKKRLVEELEDMNDTCSTGHFNRIINALNGFDSDIFHISFDEQLKMNIIARFTSKIKEEKEPEIAYSLCIAKTNMAEAKDKEIYSKFIDSTSGDVYNELKKEFVDSEYLNEEQFDKIFSDTMSECVWM